MKNKVSRRRRQCRAELRFDTVEGLEIHRELHLLRLLAEKPRRGHQARHRRHLDYRERKLRRAERDFDPEFGRKEGEAR